MSENPRPPYVRFESRAIEDRNATIEAGHYVSRDVHFAIITPPGSKDQIEKNAAEWLADTAKSAKEGRVPEEWIAHFNRAYDAWKEGQELPEEGTPIRLWPAISGSQAEAVIRANIRTVEDLAAANESALMAIGMGARSLKQRAENWLQEASSVGKGAEKVSALQQEVESLKKTVADQNKQIFALKEKLKEDA